MKKLPAGISTNSISTDDDSFIPLNGLAKELLALKNIDINNKNLFIKLFINTS